MQFQCSTHSGRSVAYRKVLWARVGMAIDIYLEEGRPRGARLWGADVGRTALAQRDWLACVLLRWADPLTGVPEKQAAA